MTNPQDVNPSEDKNQQATAEEARMREQFQVGGVDRELSPEEQLEQLASYIYAHYEVPTKNPPWSEDPSDAEVADTYDARLADRTTHAAMLMLGSAVDHAMPGVAFPGDVTVTDLPELHAQVFTPSKPNGKWAISLHFGGWWRGSGVALDNAWRPEVAGAAELSGTTIVDLDYPLLPAHTLNEVIDAVYAAAQWVRSNHNPDALYAWGYSSGGALATLCADAFDGVVLTYPHLTLDVLPDELRDGRNFTDPHTWPRTLMQVATHDKVAGHYPWAEEPEQVQVREYVSEHRLSTPAVARQRVRDVAEFLAS